VSEASPYLCDHEETETRRRVVAGGRVAYYKQCLRCGAGVRAVKPGVSAGPGFCRDFDEALRERWQAERSAWFAEHAAVANREWRERRAGEDAAFWAEYDAYLQTPAWRERRRRVLERAGGVCEGCGERRAVHAHHLSYRRLGDEMLWELVAVCYDCHAKLHPRLAPTIVGGVGRYAE
jgi:5-methylcytosine-specific restriction endonuclease McrA